LTPFASADDRSLLRAVADGDRNAFAELYGRHGRYVMGLAIRVVRDSDTAQEIVQDVFTRVWQKAAAYDAGQAGVATWIMRIARNRAIDELRRRGARPVLDAISDDSPLADTAAPLPDEAADAALRRARVREALATLPDKQRQAVSLAFFGGRTHAEIARELREPLGTVKTRIRTALQTLRERLAGEEPA
jgi:RNA polymerase sigma-70 factor, ECF subfamily